MPHLNGLDVCTALVSRIRYVFGFRCSLLADVALLQFRYRILDPQRDVMALGLELQDHGIEL